MAVALLIFVLGLQQVPFEPLRPKPPAPAGNVAPAKPDAKPAPGPPPSATWQSAVAIWTRPVAELSSIPLTSDIDHDSEVARDEAVMVVVTLQGCQPDAAGTCKATADVVTQKPDGTVHSETKNVALTRGRGTAAITFTPNDVTGVYTVIATVRDPEARRVARTERLFGVK